MHLFVIFLFSFIGLSLGSAINSENDSIAALESIREQLKTVEDEIQSDLRQEKLKWQLEVFQKWYRDSEKCSHDISYIFNDWTVIYRRTEGSEEFDRKWTDYQKGFGAMDQDYFIGLELLHFLTSTENQTQELLVLLGDNNGNVTYAKYDNFQIGGVDEKYSLKELNSYSGTAGDSLIYHKGKEFSTFDQDNDDSDRNCAQLWKGGWWFKYCLESPKGMVWESWYGLRTPLKFSQMMIRNK